MKYRRKFLLSGYIKRYTPFWIDLINYKSRQQCCIFLRYKMSDAMKDTLDKMVENNSFTSIFVTKKEGDDFFYDFRGFGHFRMVLGNQARTKRFIAGSNLRETLDELHNPVKGKGSTGRLKGGGTAAINFGRTGGMLSSALQTIDNSAVYKDRAIKEEKKIARKKEYTLLVKLRKKHFFEKEELCGDISDRKWDIFLLDREYSNSLTIEERLQRNLI